MINAASVLALARWTGVGTTFSSVNIIMGMSAYFYMEEMLQLTTMKISIFNFFSQRNKNPFQSLCECMPSNIFSLTKIWNSLLRVNIITDGNEENDNNTNEAGCRWGCNWLLLFCSIIHFARLHFAKIPASHGLCCVCVCGEQGKAERNKVSCWWRFIRYPVTSSNLSLSAQCALCCLSGTAVTLKAWGPDRARHVIWCGPRDLKRSDCPKMSKKRALPKRLISQTSPQNSGGESTSEVGKLRPQVARWAIQFGP